MDRTVKEYAQAIEEVVSGRTASNYGSYRSSFESISAAMIAYIYEIDIGIVFTDISVAKEYVEAAKKAERKAKHRSENEERRQANLSRRHNDETNRSTD